MNIAFCWAIFLSYVLRFTNPRVLTPQDTILTDTLVSRKGTDSLDFSGSKGFFVTFDGFAYSLSQKLDISVSGRVSSKYIVKGRLFDSNTHYESGYYTSNLRDLDEVFFEIADTSANHLKLGKVGISDLKILGFTGRFKNFDFSYGATNVGIIKKELMVNYPDLGPYFVDYGYLIVPGSVKVFKGEELLDKSKYEFDYQSGILWIRDAELLKDPDRFFVEYSSYKHLPSIFWSFSYTDRGFKAKVEHLSDTKKYYEGLPDTIKDFISQSGDIENFIEFKGGVKGEGGSYVLQDSVFVFVGEGKGDYIVYFDFVGVGKGSYIFDNFLGAYKFVGFGAGHYEPIMKIAPPREYNVFSFGRDGDLSFDIKVSYCDLNSLSVMDDRNNVGFKAFLSKKFEVRDIRFTLGLNGRTTNFKDLREYSNKFFGIESRNRLADHFGNIYFPFANTFLEYSIGLNGRQTRSVFQLRSDPRPFSFILSVARSDTTNVKLFIKWVSSKFPDGFVLLQNLEKPYVFEINDKWRNLDYAGGFIFNKELRKVLPYLTFKLLEDGSQIEFLAEFAYIYRSKEYPFLRVNLSYGLTECSRIYVGMSRTPELIYYKEERYYKSPWGKFDYDQNLGLYIPSRIGVFDRHILLLGVKDTSVKNGLELEFNSKARGHMVCIKWSQRRGLDDVGTSLNGQVSLNQHSVTAFVTKYVDNSFLKPYIRREQRYTLDISLYKLFFFTPLYECYVQDSFSYRYISSGFDLRLRALILRFAPTFTWYEGINYRTLSIFGTWNFERGNWRGFLNVNFNFPVGREGKSLPIFVPTSERYVLGLNIKYRYKSGEFFADALYTKSFQSLKRIRSGYNFLF